MMKVSIRVRSSGVVVSSSVTLVIVLTLAQVLIVGLN